MYVAGCIFVQQWCVISLFEESCVNLALGPHPGWNHNIIIKEVNDNEPNG